MQKMIYFKIVALLIISCLLTSCMKRHDFDYYLNHPEVLKQDLAKCQQQADNSALCKKLQSYQNDLNNTLLAAQSNPYAFGITILNIQREIALLQEKLEQLPTVATQNASANDERTKMTEQLKIYQKTNRTYMSIIRWLENPEA